MVWYRAEGDALLRRTSEQLHLNSLWREPTATWGWLVILAPAGVTGHRFQLWGTSGSFPALIHSLGCSQGWRYAEPFPCVFSSLPNPPAQPTSVTSSSKACAKGSGLGLVWSCLLTLLNNS